MDPRRVITDRALREALNQHEKPLEPLLFTERTMRAVRQAHERRLRRERQLFFVPVVVVLLLLIGVGGWYLATLRQLPVQEMTTREFLFGSVVLCSALLYLLQDILCRRWNIPR